MSDTINRPVHPRPLRGPAGMSIRPWRQFLEPNEQSFNSDDITHGKAQVDKRIPEDARVPEEPKP